MPEKMSVEMFATKLKGGNYKNLGGARKAISKGQSLSSSDKERCGELAEKHFAGAPVSSAPKKVREPKVAKTKAVKAAKTSTIDAPKKRRGRPPRNPVVADAAPTPRQPATSHSDMPTSFGNAESKSNIGTDPVAIRLNAASTIVQEMSKTGLHRQYEQKLYHVALAEYNNLIGEASKRDGATYNKEYLQKRSAASETQPSNHVMKEAEEAEDAEEAEEADAKDKEHADEESEASEAQKYQFIDGVRIPLPAPGTEHKPKTNFSKALEKHKLPSL